MSTYSAKPTEVERKWYVIDASETTLGRLSTEIANLLTGKNKPMFTKHIDCGDYVIVINADKLVVTGDKLEKKIYYRHTKYPGGLKETKLKDQMEKDSTAVITSSVRGMLPVNKLRQDRLARLKVYSSEEHNHAAQKPVNYSVKEGK
jgi:large subunit ribosomal protein L13